MPWNVAFVLERRQAGDQHLAVGMKRLPKHVGDIRDLGKVAGVHDPDPIDDLGHQPHVVPDQQQRRAQLFLDLRRVSIT